MSDTLINISHVNLSLGGTPILKDISLSLDKSHVLGIVGESGSGKSTLAKTIVSIYQPDSGSIWVDHMDAANATRRELAEYRRKVQLIPQDPYSSLSPRLTIGKILAEAIDPVHAKVKSNHAAIAHWLERVGLAASMIDRYPHEFSGGQRQRIAIARGLIMQPSLVIADEITSALDVSVQAQILNLLQELKQSLGLTMIFISHNLAVVQQICDEVAVIYHGKIVEQGDKRQIYENPQHWYTQSLLAADPGSPHFTLEVDDSIRTIPQKGIR
ncbi:MAG: ABC transporter ATP-binding protein [Bifidobacterium tibiigranuli]|jgi:peptide/nickel transport system ATP-binding protein|uniref:ATP-binding cassette domain-containing protein n=1 Tax=Bifidobacterium tibiigranuli TaxID=2172043 RepID=UPI0026EF93E5|nr:ABC transporter ATP-binding protein [Bifidobacterium tibiigranuli]MCI1674025.1 ABC transporter ATP-binding protein [Bifidobacterium tibiigranuli]MCI1714003.1 ABC transporter ATP-binding protein [Bifidobacterium tibiigranuli]MCI1833393.1 ABC transporter ATP-binding protein [Bifidobacterium tibiigranuli]